MEKRIKRLIKYYEYLILNDPEFLKFVLLHKTVKNEEMIDKYNLKEKETD